MKTWKCPRAHLGIILWDRLRSSLVLQDEEFCTRIGQVEGLMREKLPRTCQAPFGATFCITNQLSQPVSTKLYRSRLGNLCLGYSSAHTSFVLPTSHLPLNCHAPPVSTQQRNSSNVTRIRARIGRSTALAGYLDSLPPVSRSCVGSPQVKVFSIDTVLVIPEQTCCLNHF